MLIKSFIEDYTSRLKGSLLSVDDKLVNKAVEMFETAFLQNSTIYVCGNGGSAAISDHFMCDHSKGISTDTTFSPKIVSLSSNMSLVTAIGNDIGYEDIFAYQLEMFGQPGDILVAVSSSGNSPNIIKALSTARKNGLRTIAMVGFDGGKAKDIADIVLHTPIHNYGIVEDSHQALMHILAQFIRIKHSTKVELKL